MTYTTEKQIIKKMKKDGMTNEEIKKLKELCVEMFGGLVYFER
jgi:DNA-binding transcriptional MerR regulator